MATNYLNVLVDSPEQFSDLHTSEFLEQIVSGTIPDAQIAAFLALMKSSKLDKDPAHIAAAASKMLQHAKIIKLNAPLHMADIVGTGGDGHNTYNASTTAAIVAAGAGLHVCKHGNKASSSKSGSADLLMSLGAQLNNVTATSAPDIIDQTKFTFLYAPVFHPAMAKVAPARKALAIPTLFNLLGPLLNPAPIRYRLIGVNSPAIGKLYAESLQLLDRIRQNHSSGIVVCGAESLDEISPAGPTHIWTFDSESIVESTVTPADFGLPSHPLSEVKSGTPEENAEYLTRLLNTPETIPENEPKLDFVLLNAAALLYISGVASSWKDGVVKARESIKSGAAKAAFETFAALSRQAADAS
ncbi:hypothetical protein CANCADRAFT_1376 [Tortispora caseinolytica NRRL Y-17796]|uniref:Anthranilate phosphoribosyltransferase n=1 Tax=Tortispora caseinolytica NRRL Y-17796 TaxID=767744 RepID=A0A1E4TM02_9ASCO|nr:hypothetical protein CANCADRAFT_1376 [Tortispora caseinolytica NRRL Y-17796]